ncbi:MAG: CoA transferase [Acetobacteraceae bacterium]
MKKQDVPAARGTRQWAQPSTARRQGRGDTALAAATQGGDRPFGGVRIIDLARELGSYATRLFADLGAEVIRIERPGGGADRWRPPLFEESGGRRFGGVPFAFLNANKKSVVVEYREERGRNILCDLVAKADIVFYEADEDRQALLPLLVQAGGRRVITVVSYFGLAGPYSDYLGSDLVAQALGGLAWLSGDPTRPPLRIAGEQTGFISSLYAAAATAIALWDVESGGAGHILDVSAQECIAHSLQNATQVYDLERRISGRGGGGTRDASENIFACKDGLVFLACPLTLANTWDSLLAWMAEEGHPGALRLSAPAWRDQPTRTKAAMHAEFREIFEAFIAGKTKAELAAEALARKLILAPVNRVADTPADRQLVFRNYFRNVAHPALDRTLTFPGAPYHLSEPVWSIARAAPLLGEHDAALLAEWAGPPATRHTE